MESFRADQRGALALEIPFVFAALLLTLLVPLADLAIAGFQFTSARQALRSFGQSIQYSPPTDLSSTTDWVNTVRTKAATTGYSISDVQLICGDSNVACSSTNTDSPKYYSYSTNVTLSPILLTPVLCTGGGGSSCTFTLTYSERFQ